VWFCSIVHHFLLTSPSAPTTRAGREGRNEEKAEEEEREEKDNRGNKAHAHSNHSNTDIQVVEFHFYSTTPTIFLALFLPIDRHTKAESISPIRIRHSFARGAVDVDVEIHDPQLLLLLMMMMRMKWRWKGKLSAVAVAVAVAVDLFDRPMFCSCLFPNLIQLNLILFT